MKKWNIVFFIQEDPDTTESTKKTSTQHFEKQISEIPWYLSFHIFILKSKFFIKGNETFQLLELAVKAENGEMKYSHKFTSLPGQIYYENLKTVFLYIQNNFPSDKTLFVTIGHGSGYGIFKHKILQPETIADEACTSAQIGVAQIETKNTDSIFSILSNEQLASAFEGGFKNRVDVLVMVNCTMLNLHSMHAFQNSVLFFVAPQGGISRSCINFTGLISTMNSNDDISAKAIASNVVQEVEMSLERVLDSSTFAVAAVDLSNFKYFTLLLNKFIVALTSWIRQHKSLKAEFRLLRNKCYPYAFPQNYFVVDFINWAQSVKKFFREDKEILNIFNELLALFESMKVAAFIGPDAYAEIPHCLEKSANLSPSGAAIHFPSLEKFIESGDNRNPGAEQFYCTRTFLQDTDWDLFIQELNTA